MHHRRKRRPMFLLSRNGSRHLQPNETVRTNKGIVSIMVKVKKKGMRRRSRRADLTVLFCEEMERWRLPFPFQRGVCSTTTASVSHVSSEQYSLLPSKNCTGPDVQHESVCVWPVVESLAALQRRGICHIHGR